MNSSINDEIRNNVVQKLDNIIGLKVVSRLIEKSIYNYTIHLAKEKNIKRNWDNNIFRGLYFSKIRSIYSNLDKESYIGNDTFLDRILNKENQKNCCRCKYIKKKGKYFKVKGPYGHCSYDRTNCCKR